MNEGDRVWGHNRGQLSCALVVCLLVATGSQAFAASCGSDPGDAAALAATRALIDSQCDCATAVSHTDYVRCARDVVSAAITGGSLSRSCGSSAMGCMRKSTCGKPGAVTCCRTSANGTTRGSIKRDAAHCVAPSGGSACVGSYTSSCDACNATGCVSPPNTAVPTPQPPAGPPVLPPRPAFCSPQVDLPRLAKVPFTTTQGAIDCGGPMLSPQPGSPFSGQVSDAANKRISYLSAGCLYTGGLPPAKVPAGATSILDVVGITGTALTLAGSAGSGPSDCTMGAGPGRHCSNGAVGNDGLGACESDDDCGRNRPGSCNFDGNCFFGPPVPVPNGILSACAVSAFLTEMCGAADLASNQTTVGTTLSSRLYLTRDGAAPCPRCIAGKCSAGKNVDGPCVGIGVESTSVDCPPDETTFVGTLNIPLTLTTSPMIANSDDAGLFCPDQASPGAFGLDKVRSVMETGSPLGGSGNIQAQTLAGVFCVPPSGSIVIDGLGGFPGMGALSAPGVLNLSGVLPLL